MRTAHWWRPWWPVVAVALLLCGLWALTLASTDQPLAVAAAAPNAAPAARVESALPAPAQPMPVVAAGPAAEPPPGVSSAQWAAIEAEVGSRPDAPAELQRLRAYLGWSDALRRFREAGGAGASTDARLALARTLEQGLGDRVRQAEVSAAEARLIESAILELTVPDAAERGERLRQWTATELAPPASADPRQAAFERRQVEIVAAWSALPPAARDRAALERELEVLRRDTFATGSARR